MTKFYTNSSRPFVAITDSVAYLYDLPYSGINALEVLRFPTTNIGTDEPNSFCI